MYSGATCTYCKVAPCKESRSHARTRALESSHNKLSPATYYLNSPKCLGVIYVWSLDNLFWTIFLTCTMLLTATCTAFPVMTKHPVKRSSWSVCVVARRIAVRKGNKVSFFAARARMMIIIVFRFGDHLFIQRCVVDVYDTDGGPRTTKALPLRSDRAASSKQYGSSVVYVCILCSSIRIVLAELGRVCQQGRLL